jgi:hypothetical protein
MAIENYRIGEYEIVNPPREYGRLSKCEAVNNVHPFGAGSERAGEKNADEHSEGDTKVYPPALKT